MARGLNLDPPRRRAALVALVLADDGGLYRLSNPLRTPPTTVTNWVSLNGDMRISAKAGADEFSTATGTFDGAMNEIVMGVNICYGYQPINIKIYNNESTTTLTHAIYR